MIDNWYDTLEIAKMRDEAIRNDIYKIRMIQKNKAQTGGHSALSNIVLGNLGKAFSTIGDSLQVHYHREFESDKKHMKKVS